MTVSDGDRSSPELRVGMRSDPGRERERNEDACLVDVERGLFAVADGMGGHPAGDVAARVAVDRLPALLDRALADQPAGVALEKALSELNEAVQSEAAVDTQLAGMGTTIVVLLVTPAVAYIGHVGDSRAYLLRDAELQQLTADHSLATDLIAAGLLDPEVADSHPFARQLTQALGTPGDVEPTVRTLDLAAGDRLLLCSDGLTDMVAEDLMRTVLAGADDPESTCQTLVDAANEAGGLDNISVVLTDYRVECQAT